jgi:hypothetical protein
MYKLSNRHDELIRQIFEAAAKAAAKDIIVAMKHKGHEQCTCDHSKEVEELAHDFLCDTMYIDDGRFGLAEPLAKAAAEGKRHADPLPPKDTAITLVRLIHHLMQRSKIQNRPKFIQNIREHLVELNPYMLSKKKNNPSAAIGAAINIMKNVLQSQPPTVISSILGQLYRML